MAACWPSLIAAYNGAGKNQYYNAAEISRWRRATMEINGAKRESLVALVNGNRRFAVAACSRRRRAALMASSSLGESAS